MEPLNIGVADLLVHGSNLILLFAYTRSDMLSLRVLAFVAAVTIVPYYVLQPSVLWAPIFWSLVYAVVHAYHITVLLIARRPIELTPDEQRLHDMSFPSLQPYEFKQLAEAGQWGDAPAGAKIDPDEDSVLLLFSGAVDARVRGERVGTIDAGELIGIALQIEHVHAGLSFVSSTPLRTVRWSREQLFKRMESSASLRAALTSLVNHDLASKLLRVATGYTRAATE